MMVARLTGTTRKGRTHAQTLQSAAARRRDGGAAGPATRRPQPPRPSSPSWCSRACRTCRCSPRRRKGFFAKRDLDGGHQDRAELGRDAQRARRRPLPDRARARSTTRSRWPRSPRPTSRWCSAATTAATSLIVQPEIRSLADLRGKTVIVDAPNTAYAFQLYEMLAQTGLKKGDYEVKPVGAHVPRGSKRCCRDKTIAASMLNPPFSIRGEGRHSSLVRRSTSSVPTNPAPPGPWASWCPRSGSRRSTCAGRPGSSATSDAAGWWS